MPTRAAAKPRRRPVRGAPVIHRDAAKPSMALTLTRSVTRFAATRAARTAFMVIGTAGLGALAMALIGPKRLEREVFKPLRDAVEPRGEKLWADCQPLRAQIAAVFRNASPEGRERLTRNFQSWIGHFRAT